MEGYSDRFVGFSEARMESLAGKKPGFPPARLAGEVQRDRHASGDLVDVRREAAHGLRNNAVGDGDVGAQRGDRSRARSVSGKRIALVAVADALVLDEGTQPSEVLLDARAPGEAVQREGGGVVAGNEPPISGGSPTSCRPVAADE